MIVCIYPMGADKEYDQTGNKHIHKYQQAKSQRDGLIVEKTPKTQIGTHRGDIGNLPPRWGFDRSASICFLQ
jgi:hypothetical protein